MVVRGRRSSELAALHDTKRTLNNRGGGGGGRSSVSSISDVSSIAGSVASKVKQKLNFDSRAYSKHYFDDALKQAKAAAQEMADIIQNEFALLEEAGAKEKFFSDSDKNSCILVIGSTGSAFYQDLILNPFIVVTHDMLKYKISQGLERARLSASARADPSRPGTGGTG